MLLAPHARKSQQTQPGRILDGVSSWLPEAPSANTGLAQGPGRPGGVAQQPLVEGVPGSVLGSLPCAPFGSRFAAPAVPGPRRGLFALPARSGRYGAGERPNFPGGRARAVTRAGGGAGRAEPREAPRGERARRGAGPARVSRRGRGRERRSRSGGSGAEPNRAEPSAGSAVRPFPCRAVPSPRADRQVRGRVRGGGGGDGLTRLAVRWGEPGAGRGLRAPVAAGAAAALGRGCGGGRAGTGGGGGGCGRGAAAQVGPGPRECAGCGRAEGEREGAVGGFGASPRRAPHAVTARGGAAPLRPRERGRIAPRARVLPGTAGARAGFGRASHGRSFLLCPFAFPAGLFRPSAFSLSLGSARFCYLSHLSRGNGERCRAAQTLWPCWIFGVFSASAAWSVSCILLHLLRASVS